MLSVLRRAAGELLVGYQRQTAAAASARAPPAAVAAALQHSCRGFSNGPEQQMEMQPFSVAIKQLEEAVTETVLPVEALAANRAAMATVKDFAKSLETPHGYHGYPPASVKNVVFVIRDPYSHGRLQRVRCQLKTTGGNCAQLVQQSLGALLQRLGLNPYFFFDGDQFRPRPPPRQRPVPRPRPAAPAKDPSPAEVEAVRAKAAAAGFPSQTVSEEQFKEMESQSAEGRDARRRVAEEVDAATEKMKKIDPLLAAVAAVPWLAATGDKVDQDKVQLIRSKVLDEIESWGWDVRGAVAKIWAGERSARILLDGKDAGSQMAIKGILFHAETCDKKYGGRRTWLGDK